MRFGVVIRPAPMMPNRPASASVASAVAMQDGGASTMATPYSPSGRWTARQLEPAVDVDRADQMASQTVEAPLLRLADGSALGR